MQGSCHFSALTPGPEHGTSKICSSHILTYWFCRTLWNSIHKKLGKKYWPGHLQAKSHENKSAGWHFPRLSLLRRRAWEQLRLDRVSRQPNDLLNAGTQSGNGTMTSVSCPDVNIIMVIVPAVARLLHTVRQIFRQGLYSFKQVCTILKKKTTKKLMAKILGQRVNIFSFLQACDYFWPHDLV